MKLDEEYLKSVAGMNTQDAPDIIKVPVRAGWVKGALWMQEECDKKFDIIVKAKENAIVERIRKKAEEALCKSCRYSGNNDCSCSRLDKFIKLMKQ